MIDDTTLDLFVPGPLARSNARTDRDVPPIPGVEA
jgi:hypothetical protein